MTKDSELQPEADLAAYLQSVLFRYTDSKDGYAHAADLVSTPGLATAFAEISAVRSATALKVAALLDRAGESPDMNGTVEGAGHRWWMSLREKMTEEDLHAMLCECIRGEKVLASTLRQTLDSPNLDERQTGVLNEALADVEKAILHFEAAVASR